MSTDKGAGETPVADARRCAECAEVLVGKFYGAGRGDGNRFMCPECFWRDRAHAYEMDMLDAREEANVLMARVSALTAIEDAARQVVAAFEAGVFVRDVSHDHESGWAIRALPHLRALGALANALSADPEPKAKPSA